MLHLSVAIDYCKFGHHFRCCFISYSNSYLHNESIIVIYNTGIGRRERTFFYLFIPDSIFNILQVDGPRHLSDSIQHDLDWKAYPDNTVSRQNDMEIFIVSKCIELDILLKTCCVKRKKNARMKTIFETFLSGYFPQHWSGSNKWFLSIAWQRAGLYRQYIGL